MNPTLWGAVLCGVFALIVIICLLIPKIRRFIFSFLDNSETTPKKTKKVTEDIIDVTHEQKVHATTKPTVQRLIQLLNETLPSTKEEIKKVVVQLYGENVCANIREDYDNPKEFPWLVQINPPDRGLPYVRILAS
jgi:hypothetical protein